MDETTRIASVLMVLDGTINRLESSLREATAQRDAWLKQLDIVEAQA